jgi:RNA-directed DNA polymerase
MLVERIAHQTGWSVNRLMDFSRSAGRKYKVFEIPKRSGGKRVIEQPSKSVKAIQRWLSRSLFSKYQIHPAAHAYRKDVSVRDNALVHSKYNYTLRVDFKDFFWSFLSDDVSQFFSKQFGARDFTDRNRHRICC